MLEKIQDEGDILRDIYVAQLLFELQNLKQKKKHPDFDNETQIYIPEALSEQGLQSISDFIKHGPFKKTLEVFTIVSDEELPNIVGKNVRVYRLIIADQLP